MGGRFVGYHFLDDEGCWMIDTTDFTLTDSYMLRSHEPDTRLWLCGDSLKLDYGGITGYLVKYRAVLPTDTCSTP